MLRIPLRKLPKLFFPLTDFLQPHNCFTLFSVISQQIKKKKNHGGGEWAESTGKSLTVSIQIDYGVCGLPPVGGGAAPELGGGQGGGAASQAAQESTAISAQLSQLPSLWRLTFSIFNIVIQFPYDFIRCKVNISTSPSLQKEAL